MPNFETWFNFLATIPSTASLIPIIATIMIRFAIEKSLGLRFKNKYIVIINLDIVTKLGIKNISLNFNKGCP